MAAQTHLWREIPYTQAMRGHGETREHRSWTILDGHHLSAPLHPDAQCPWGEVWRSLGIPRDLAKSLFFCSDSKTAPLQCSQPQMCIFMCNMLCALNWV